MIRENLKNLLLEITYNPHQDDLWLHIEEAIIAAEKKAFSEGFEECRFALHTLATEELNARFEKLKEVKHES